MSIADNADLQGGRLLNRVFRSDVRTLAPPPVLLVLGWSVVRLWRSGRRMLAIAAVPAVLAPLALNAVAWDTPRFAFMMIYQAFLLLVAVERATPAPVGGGPLVGLAVIVALNGLRPVPTMGSDDDGDGALMVRGGPRWRSFEGCTPVFPNAGFERGDLRDWKATGDPFTVRPARTPYGNRIARMTSGEWWVDSRSGSGRGNDAVGTIESKPFDVTGDTLLLAVGGGRNDADLRTALVVDGEEVRVATGGNRDALGAVAWDTTAFAGKSARVRITDRATGRWGHVDADGFCWFR